MVIATTTSRSATTTTAPAAITAVNETARANEILLLETIEGMERGGPMAIVIGAGHSVALDVPNGGNFNGNQLQAWPRNGSPAQQWAWLDGKYLFNALTGKCLDRAWNGLENFAKVHLWDCNWSDSQQWIAYGDKIRPLNHQDRCLTIQWPVQTGQKAQMYDCVPADTQLFYFE
ncbi:Aste57867_5407 [Aphanomyces stellatus]|uniref:Aste57867_5407 protein n=1 Tax=Aphanomyces stellatus TaxID=120398 RepID=A0A485KHA5_9STRA|nr:hypothetical protein As57867_005394 [Aphanomyces stellatus]VFT82463.1 Aste57867_5407 [Aphanomyces stellatus]